MNGKDLKIDYSKETVWFKCGKCETGKIEYIHEQRGPMHEIEIMPCDSCRKIYSLRACEKLELIEVV